MLASFTASLRLAAAFIRYRRVFVRPQHGEGPVLPPVARYVVPSDAPGEHHEWHNAARKAAVIALDLYRAGLPEPHERNVRVAAQLLGWPTVSPRTHVMVRAIWAVLRADLGVKVED
ncbi:hypothetical protein [Streptomyces smyrnaeus]|uniref:hypothetical protein n=1 Tax=Streptomyces smyrnaeus TaxID=1387713 RepID=UPI000C18F83A